MASILNRIRIRLRYVRYGLTLRPVAGADGDDDDSGDDADKSGDDADKSGDDAGKSGDDSGGDADKSGDASKSGDDSGDDDSDDGAGEPVKPKKSAEEYRRELRRTERRAKKEADKNKKLEERLKKIEESNKTDQQKAIDKARAEGESTAKEAAAAERKADRLENAVIRAAARGLKVEEETHRFADPEDAMLHLQRAIRDGDVDEEELFNEQGRVSKGALKEALGEILEDKPYLRAESGEKKGGKKDKPEGGSEGGKGEEEGKGLEDLTVDDHFNRIRRHKDDSGIRSVDRN